MSDSSDTVAESGLGPSDRDSPRAPGLCYVAAALLTVGLLSLVAWRGWIPLDEGTLAQTASNILDGLWPHVDFLDVYPGLLGVFHAGLFTAFGESLMALRFGWLAMAALASVSGFSILRHRMRGETALIASVAITVFAFVFYAASMPTWWNVAIGLAAIAVVYRAWRLTSPLLAAAAGLLLAASSLIKSTGGALVAVPVLIWLLATDPSVTDRWRHMAALAGSVLVLAILIPSLSWGRLLLLGIPALAGLVAVLRVRSEAQGPSGLWRPYLLGVLAPPIVVVLLYTARGAAGELWSGWVGTPALRFGAAEQDIPLSLTMIVLVMGAILVGRLMSKRRLSRAFTPALVCAGIVLLWLVEREFSGAALIGFLALVPPLIAAQLFRPTRGADPLVALVSAAALMFLLVQIPFWNGTYVAYSAAPLLLAAVLLAGDGRVLAIAATATFAGLLLVSSATGYLVTGVAVDDSVDFVELTAPSAGLTVPHWDGYYNDLVDEVARVAEGSEVYAGPDSPEVTFLAQVEPATSTFFEVLDPDWNYDTIGRIAEQGNPVVINHDPHFSDPIPESELERIYSANPNSKTFDKFELTWANADG